MRDEVKGACELLGLDPLYVANEGKLVAIVAPEAADAVVAAMRAHPRGAEAAMIGTVTERVPGTGDRCGPPFGTDPHRRSAGRRPVAEDLLSMHEMGIANSVLEAVHKEVDRHRRARATKSACGSESWPASTPSRSRSASRPLVKGSGPGPLVLGIEDGRAPTSWICVSELELEEAMTRGAYGEESPERERQLCRESARGFRAERHAGV